MAIPTVNPLNAGFATIRLAATPKNLSEGRKGGTNADGSKTVSVTGYVDDNYPDRDGNYGSQKVSFQAYVSSKTQGLGPFEASKMPTGSMHAIAYRIRNNDHEENGRMVYGQILEIVSIQHIFPTNTRQNAGGNADASTGDDAGQVADQGAEQSYDEPPF